MIYHGKTITAIIRPLSLLEFEMNGLVISIVYIYFFVNNFAVTIIIISIMQYG